MAGSFEHPCVDSLLKGLFPEVLAPDSSLALSSCFLFALSVVSHAIAVLWLQSRLCFWAIITLALTEPVRVLIDIFGFHRPLGVESLIVTWLSATFCIFLCVVWLSSRQSAPVVPLTLVFVGHTAPSLWSAVAELIANKYDQSLIHAVVMEGVESLIVFFLFVRCLMGPSSVSGGYSRLSQTQVDNDLAEVEDEDDVSVMALLWKTRPYVYASILSHSIFSWVGPLLTQGSRAAIEMSDLYDLPKDIEAKRVANILHANWVSECQHWAAARQTALQFSRPNLQPSPRHPHRSISSGCTDPPPLPFFSALPPGFASEMSTAPPPSLVRALWQSFGQGLYIRLGAMKFMADMLALANPLLLRWLLDFIDDGTGAIGYGYACAAALAGCTIVTALLRTHYDFQIQKMASRVRGALMMTLYHHVLHTPLVSQQHFSTGEIMNFMSTDTQKMTDAVSSFNEFLSLPVQIGVALYLLYQQVAGAFLAGLAVCLIMIPLNMVLARAIQRISERMMKHRDERVRRTGELLHGIRLVKLHAWESHFEQHFIADPRSLEVTELKKKKYLDALCVYMWATTPVFVSLVTFATYVWLGNDPPLTAGRAFTALAVFNTLIYPLNAFPWVINGLVEAWVSNKRLTRYFTLDGDPVFAEVVVPSMTREFDITNAATAYYEAFAHHHSHLAENGNIAVAVMHGTFTWSRAVPSGSCPVPLAMPAANGEFRLRSINCEIAPGQLVGIIGKPGSGKSSILHALLLEMRKMSGAVFIPSRGGAHLKIAYVPQQAFVVTGTLKHNVLFGLPFDETRYQDALRLSCLAADLLELPEGDRTMIGERGVTLSGGQKTRVCLARAVYCDAEVFLLDDPLSSVDPHVARAIFTEGILGLVRTKRKTIILNTHHQAFLRDADLVFEMCEGNLNDITASFKASQPSISPTGPSAPCAAPSSSEATESPKPMMTTKKPSAVDDDADDEGEEGQPASHSVDGVRVVGDVVASERRERGGLKRDAIGVYTRNVGYGVTFLVMLFMFLMQSSRNISDAWISSWVNAEKDQKGSGRQTGWYLTIFAYVVLANSLAAMGRAFSFAYAGLVACIGLHDRLLNTLLKASLLFFTSTPTGRLLNRFSRDVIAIDEELPFQLNRLLAQTFLLIGSFAVICYGTSVWMGLAFVPLMVLYYGLQQHYRQSSRELKRLDSLTRSPIFEQFTETLDGGVVIRAMDATARFSVEACRRIADNQRVGFTMLAANEWFGLRLQFIGCAIVTGVSLWGVVSHHKGQGDTGLLGLALSYALPITGSLSGLISAFTAFEQQMISVERVAEYLDVPPEPALDMENRALMSLSSSSSFRRPRAFISPPPTWPSQGSVLFRSVTMGYVEGAAPVLRDVSFSIVGGMKVGICGRTGAGKSSLINALFNVVSLTSGCVLIDGVDVRTVRAHELRTKLTIINQDPFVFAGSVRMNVDPLQEHSDGEIWDALTQVELSIFVHGYGGLGFSLEEGGANISMGQRQLLCLARVLLQKGRRIVVLDEATASIDLATDRIVQRVVRTAFAEATVLVIAHRMHTILDGDLVLVMDRGTVVEHGPPKDLLANPTSRFHAMVNNASASPSSPTAT